MTSNPTAHASVFLPQSLKDDPKIDAFLETLESMGSQVAWLAERSESGITSVYKSLKGAQRGAVTVIADCAEDLQAASMMYGIACLGIVTGTDLDGMSDMIATGQRVVVGIENLARHFVVR